MVEKFCLWALHKLKRFLMLQMALGKRVLELGAGTGLLGIYLSLLGASVTMADNNELVLSLLRRNVERNKSSAQVVALDWCNQDAHLQFLQPDKPLDYVFGADCVYSLQTVKGYVPT